ncbi:MAG: PAS domain-containing protein, partial [Gammaproteobacteria bacterium]|nr:PAS domain-containing protein [Gammaproteobacteria bacterium]
MKHSLRDLLLGHEDWLIYRVIDYAKANDYSQYTPTLVSAWRESVVGLRDELVRALDAHPEPLPMPADHDYCTDPHTEFAVGSARRHRARGVTLALFLGLTKFFRLTFLDLVDEAGWSDTETRRAREYIARYFDRIELAISIDWASLGENEKIAEVQDKNRALANEKDKYLTIFESLEDPVFVLDETNGFENMNGAAWRLFGVENDPGELYYRPEGASAALEAVVARLDPSSLVDGASLTLQTSDGESFFDVRRRDILDICDKYAGSVVILNDVTTHKHALRAAEEANRAKSAFLATMTHELRTPLNGVLGAMRLIRDEGLTDAQEEFADTIERSGERLLGVINNVLDYSRIEAGRIEIEHAPFELSETLDGVLAIVRPRAIESGVHLTLAGMLPGNTHRLGDAGKIQQVLLNLVGNAMKF